MRLRRTLDDTKRRMLIIVLAWYPDAAREVRIWREQTAEGGISEHRAKMMDAAGQHDGYAATRTDADFRRSDGAIQRPTETRAMQLYSDARMQKLDERVRAIWSAYERLPPSWRSVIGFSFWDAAHPSRAQIIRWLHISERTYYYWLELALEQLARDLPEGWERPEEWFGWTDLE